MNMIGGNEATVNKGVFHILAAAAAFGCLGAQPIHAQMAGNMPATAMWGVGTSTSNSNNSANSAAMHQQNALVAGSVNASEEGLLLTNGMNMTIQAIGSQSIVSTTIYGDNNQVDVVADQTSENSGDVTNHGTMSATGAD